MFILKTCAYCGKEFAYDGSRPKRRFCSRKCDLAYVVEKKRKLKILIKTCAICNKEFSTCYPLKKTCSPECSKILEKKSKQICRKKYYPTLILRKTCKVYFFNCKNCGKLFTAKCKTFNFCSKKCSQTYTNKVKRERRIKILHTRRCHDCGKLCYNYRCASCQKKWKRKNSIYDRIDRYWGEA